MADISASSPGINIGQALRDLPMENPTSIWPLLSRQLPVQKPRRHFPLALAASLALLALVPLSIVMRGSGLTTNTNQTGTGLQALMQQSAQLENILVATQNSTTNSASAEAISLALEDQIHVIDAELGNAGLSATQQQILWQKRIGILQDITQLFSSQRFQQAEGRPYEIALVESI